MTRCLLYQVAYFFKIASLPLLLLFLQCAQPVNSKLTAMLPDIQGHRGCRGLYPENTVPAFLHALELGVKTLEMDVVISGDQQVIVSHEAFFNPEISTKPDGTYFTDEAEGRKYSLFQLSYAEIKKYDVGLKQHPRFPNQKKIAVTKPLLDEVLTECESLAAAKNIPVFYNIEIKREEGGDGLYQPDVKTFVSLVTRTVIKKGLEEKVTIQSFDTEILNEIHVNFPAIKTILLIENTLSPEENLKKLNHVPYGYSPNYKLVSARMSSLIRGKGIKLVPWTVNDIYAAKSLIEMGVDGIITDYPDQIIKLIKK